MGLFISKLFSKLFGPKDVKMLLLGLAGAGKTTFLYQLKLGEVITSVPTIGFNVESVDYKNLKFSMWDIGGQDLIRKLWQHYYPGTDGVIYIVDSSDKDTIDIAKEELNKLLLEDELKNASFLVIANKQDMAVMSVKEIAEKLGLYKIKDREWFIQGACSLSGEGIYQGLDWMAKSMSKKKN